MAKKNPEINPFVQALEIKAIWKLDSESGDHSSDEGKVAGRYNVRLLETDNRCTVYPHYMLPWFKQLSTSAKDMVMYIMLKLGFNTDVIEIREDKYCEEMGVSRATFFSAKTAITNRLIIPRVSRSGTYWINPAYLYKGDRAKAYRKNVHEVNEHPIAKLKQAGQEQTVYDQVMAD